jgi:thiol-disulfide isomerase/thioredoxin
MKKQFQITSLLLILAIFPTFMVCCQNKNNSYSIDIELKNITHGETLFLQKYVGKTLVTVDSNATSSTGKIFFKGKTYHKPGMYSININQKLLANFFISNTNDQHFSISLDAMNPAQTLAFTGSTENQAFIDYLRFLGSKQQSQSEIKLKGEQLQKQFPGSMLALFIHTLREPEIPEPAFPVDDIQEYSYRYMANHFFDNIDFADKRLLNTPLLEQKLGSYFRQMVVPQPDSISEKVEMVLERAKANNEVYNWTVRYLYNLYREAPIKGNTEVYNFIGENYIIADPNRWNDPTFVGKVRDRVSKAKLNPVGSIATNLKLQTPDGKTIVLLNIKAPQTILLFFNPGCEACRPVTDALSKLYKQYRSKGIQVFAVYVDKQKGEWLNYIAEKGLEWINVYDPSGAEAIDQKYDINAIPMIYLLDKNKKIIAKDITLQSLEDYLK